MDLPDGALVNHAVFLNLGADAICEARVDETWQEHRFPRHGVTVFPSGLTHAVRWCRSPLDVLAVEIDPGFAGAMLRGRSPSARIRPALGGRRTRSRRTCSSRSPRRRGWADRSAPCARSPSPPRSSRTSRAATFGPPPTVPQLPHTPSRAPSSGAYQSRGGQPSRRSPHAAAARGSRRDGTVPLRAGVQAEHGALAAPLRGGGAHRAREGAALRRAALDHQIALRTGFATPSHFSVTFRRITGTTPRAFRESPRR